MPEAPAHRVPDSQAPRGQECPCCKRGGWMRDLPPQAQGLEPAGPTFHDLPGLTDVWERTLEPAAEPPRLATGPPTALSPHAAPVGCVRLLT